MPRLSFIHIQRCLLYAINISMYGHLSRLTFFFLRKTVAQKHGVAGYWQLLYTKLNSSDVANLTAATHVFGMARKLIP